MDKPVKRNRKFVWTAKAVKSLISLYGENIKNFLNPCKVQTILWRKLVELMKTDESIEPEIREGLSPPVVQRKWSSLQRQFKEAFYSSSFAKQSSFPYYKRMFELFTDYATEHLNNTFSGNITEAEISAFVGDLLNDSGDPDGLRCESSQIQQTTLNKTNSEASKVCKELAKLPRDSVYVKKEVMRVIPNTPFNRRVQLSTIMNQRNAMISSSNRNHDSEAKVTVKKRRISLSPEPENDFTIHAKENLFDFKIEALNECDLMEISKPTKFELMDFTQKISMPLAESSILNTPVNFKRSNGRFSDLQFLETSTQSIIEVPSLDLPSCDDLRCATQNSFVTNECESMNETPQARASCEAPPAWFQQFLDRHDANMSRIDAKLSDISSKLSRILGE